MQAESLNTGWRVRPRTGGPFQQLRAGEEGWQEVTLPHDAMLGNARDPDGERTAGYFTFGEFEYERVLDIPTEWDGDRILVRFEGIYRDAVVFLNGETIASQPSGYTELVARLDDRLVYGEPNLLRVECRATRFDNRWYPGIGLHRDVTIFRGPPVHLALDGVVVTTPTIGPDDALVVVESIVENTSPRLTEVRLRCEILDDDGNVCAIDEQPVSIGAGASARVRSAVRVADPRRWAPEHPHLYAARVEVLRDATTIDDEATTFGLRTISVDATGGFRLNGETVKLRGACVHADNGILGMATIGRAEERRIELLKAAGFNAVRSSHQPMSRAMLDACDRHGVLVMDEAFDQWAMRKREDDYSRHFRQWWRTDLEVMVAKDRNHPSVVMYSIGNEILEIGSRTGSLMSRELADALRALDPTRPITNGVSLMFASAHGVGWDPTTLLNTALSGDIDHITESDEVGVATEEAFAVLDVAGYNYAHTRYAKDGVTFPHRVIVGTETFPSEIDLFWREVLANDHVIGDFTWTGFDYLGEVGIGRVVHESDAAAETDDRQFMGPYPWRYAWCGDIDIIGQRLPVSYYREIVFGLRRDPYIAVTPPDHHDVESVHDSKWAWGTAVGSWTWDGDEGRDVTIEVYADADEVELLQDGTSLGRQPCGAEQRFRAAFTTSYQPGELVAVARRDGVEIGRTSLVSAQGPLQLRLDVDRDRIVADEHDLAFVTISLVDAAGTLHTSADRDVTVSVEGDGVLQGLGTAQPDSEESFLGTTCTTFRGQALAVLRPTVAGTITIRVACEGLSAAEASVAVSE